MNSKSPSSRILQLWATKVRVARLELGDFWSDNGVIQENYRNSSSVIDVYSQWGKLLDAFSVETGLSISGGFRVDQVLTKQFYEGAYSGFVQCLGRLYSLLILKCSISVPRSRQSGRIFIYDPRSGAANVFVPSLPFGRPLVVDPELGLVLIFPSFLRYLVAPLEGKDQLTIASIGLA